MYFIAAAAVFAQEVVVAGRMLRTRVVLVTVVAVVAAAFVGEVAAVLPTCVVLVIAFVGCFRQNIINTKCKNEYNSPNQILFYVGKS